MGFFSKGSSPAGERSVFASQTLAGGPVIVPEEIGAMPRRARLMGEAVRRVGTHPAAQRSSAGVPLGDGQGMEEIVEVIKPLFANERSLTRWVAIRGALLFLDMITPNEQAWLAVVAAMGIGFNPDPFTGEVRAEPLVAGLSPAIQTGVIGLFSSLSMRLQDYDRAVEMSVQQVNADPSWGGINEGVALDYIAWVAVAMWRSGDQQPALQIPEAGRLEEVGWYADPLFAKAERYWNGEDWTDRMRVREGRRWDELSVPLR